MLRNQKLVLWHNGKCGHAMDDRTDYLRKFPTWLMVIVFLGGLWGCAGTAVRKESDRVAERVNAYWEARVKDDVETMYKYEEFSVTKETTLIDYARRRTVARILGFRIEDISLNQEGDEARVEVEVKHRWLLPGMPSREGVSNTVETWVLLENDWYRKYRPPLDRRQR